MLLKDYLNKTTHDRRILIVSDLVRGQALIRMYEEKTGQMVRNVACMTISQMTDVLYRYILAADGYNFVFLNEFQGIHKPFSFNDAAGCGGFYSFIIPGPRQENKQRSSDTMLEYYDL